MVNMKADPAQGREYSFGTFKGRWNGLGGEAHLVCCLDWRHKARDHLNHACVGEVDMRGIKGRIEFAGSHEMLNAVLHAVPLQGLPFVVSAQEKLVRFAVLG